MKTSIITLLMIGTSITMLANGQELYKKCTGCHGEDGKTSALQKSAIIAAQESNLTIKQLTAYKNGELNQYGLGNIMKLQLTTITDVEIEELANYIASMQKDENNKNFSE